MPKPKSEPERKPGDLVCTVNGRFYVSRMNMRTLRSIAETTGVGVEVLRSFLSLESFSVDVGLKFMLGAFLPLHPNLTMEELEADFDEDKSAFSKVLMETVIAWTKSMSELWPKDPGQAEAPANPQTAPVDPTPPGASPAASTTSSPG